MALQFTGKPRNWPGMCDNFLANPSVSADQAMTAAGHFVCPVLQAYKDITITHMGFLPQAATGSPTGTFTVESIDVATGLPNGVWTAGATVTTGTLVTGVWVLAALGTAAVIPRGSWFGAKFAMASGTTLTSGRLQNYGSLTSGPYQVNNTTGTPAKGLANNKCMALGTSSTVFVPFDTIYPVQAYTANAFNNTSGDTRGVRFTPPHTMQATGIRTFINNQTGNFDLLLLDDAGADLGSTSISVDKDLVMTSAAGWVEAFFTLPVVLVPGTFYRMVIRPTSVTNTGNVIFTLPSLNYRSGMPGGTNFTYTTFTGSWDDSNTAIVPLMDILYDQLDDGISTGGMIMSRARMGT